MGAGRSVYDERQRTHALWCAKLADPRSRRAVRETGKKVPSSRHGRNKRPGFEFLLHTGRIPRRPFLPKRRRQLSTTGTGSGVERGPLPFVECGVALGFLKPFLLLRRDRLVRVRRVRGSGVCGQTADVTASLVRSIRAACASINRARVVVLGRWYASEQ